MPGHGMDMLRGWNTTNYLRRLKKGYQHVEEREDNTWKETKNKRTVGSRRFIKSGEVLKNFRNKKVFML